jgi:predicted phosphodiesterase
MTIGALADIHGNFAAMSRAMGRHPEVPFWLCVGDVASRTGAYPEPRTPLYWIKGNNEDFDRIAEWEAGRGRVANLHLIANGTCRTVGALTVAGLGGTYAATWIDAPAAQLPRKPGDDTRRHFVRDEVEACKQMRGIDILMTHEAAGKSPIDEVLASMQPRLHLCGHHHRFVETVREGVRSVCIDRVNRSYLLIDVGTLDYTKIDQ